MTDAQRLALEWFALHGGDAKVLRGGVILCRGIIPKFTAATWKALKKGGLVQRYIGPGGFVRLRITTEGQTTAEFSLARPPLDPARRLPAVELKGGAE